MTNGPEDNPFQAPESGASFADYELPEQLELYPICIVTGSRDDLQKVTQSIECGPWPLKVIHRCSTLTAVLFLSQVPFPSDLSQLPQLQISVAFGSCATFASFLCWLVWRVTSHRTAVTFFVTKLVWKRNRKKRWAWGLSAIGMLAALILLAVSFSWPATGRRSIVFTMTPTLLLLALYVCIENAFQKFSIPSLIRHQGQPMLQVSRVYQEMAHRVGETAEMKPEEELASATSDWSGDETEESGSTS